MKKKLLFTLGTILCILSAISIFAQETYPINDIENPRERCYAFVNATIQKDANTVISNGTLVIRQGKIVSVGTTVKLPKDAVVVDCKGKFIYPSFIDIYTDYGEQMPKRESTGPFSGYQMVSNKKGAYGWNQAIVSERDASQSFNVNESKAKEYRGAGFGTVLTHVPDGIARGTGLVVSLANQKENKVILKERASAHYSFDKGSSTQDYPGSLMGSIALLRQTFLDAAWYKTKPATEGVNLSLQAWNDNQNLPQIFECADKWMVLRADKVGDEYGVQYIFRGAGDEYQRIKEIKATGGSFIIPINFPMPMDVEDPTDARFVSLRSLKHWELAPTNPGTMEKEGINFALTTNGLKDISAFWTNLRKAIKYGLSKQKAFDALTKTPATLLNIYDKVGSLDAGKVANFIITSDTIFSDKMSIYDNWVQGENYNVKENGWKNIKGKYDLTIGSETYKLTVKGDATAPTAELIKNDTAKVDISLTNNLIKLTISFKKDTLNNYRLTGVAENELWAGTGQQIGGKWVSWNAIKTETEKPVIDTPKTSKGLAAIGSEVTYPFDGYGSNILKTPETILFKGAMVWTNESAGKLEEDVLVEDGKIAAIGKNLDEGKYKNVQVIDAKGKHLTPGIIDEHSHIAVTGGVNECSQSVTAEVRIADAIYPEDINIYRQLSGGVTTSHILHGSCNTIGGQTQLIKLRWGANAEQMKVLGWDPFIKFALGENVKRSYQTWGNNRFPDSRMGVEELLNDAFTRATDYEKQGPNKRKDLELETLCEIIHGKRFITCHSYVQSEITALMRIAEKYNFRVNTFTHILEGYKVADKMKQHGAYTSTFSDWWAYKMEVADAIPQNATLMQKEGLNVAINSDDPEMARRLNQEAAKSVKYGGMDEQDALKMVTLNPAKMLHIAERTGSIKVGKDADLVLWSDHPLSIYAKSLVTMVDGVVYFDREKDALQQQIIAKEKERLIQKMIAAKKNGDKTTPAVAAIESENYCEEDGSGDSKTIWDRIKSRSLATGVQGN